MTTEVEVVAQAPLLQSDRADIAQTFTAKEIGDLPNIGRNVHGERVRAELDKIFPTRTTAQWLADLHEADLNLAYLSAADLKHANLNGANLTDCWIPRRVRLRAFATRRQLLIGTTDMGGQRCYCPHDFGSASLLPPLSKQINFG